MKLLVVAMAASWRASLVFSRVIACFRFCALSWSFAMVMPFSMRLNKCSNLGLVMCFISVKCRCFVSRCQDCSSAWCLTILRARD